MQSPPPWHPFPVRLIPASLLHSDPGPAAWFTGQVSLEAVVNTSLIGVHVFRVSFQPGARTAWHKHPGGQILLVTSGNGLVQKRGEPVQRIPAGSTVVIAAGEEHWHGAAPDAFMQHIAIQPAGPAGDTEWLQHVSESDYHSPVAGLFEPTMAEIAGPMLNAAIPDWQSMTAAEFRASDRQTLQRFAAAPPIPGSDSAEIESRNLGALPARHYLPPGADPDSLVVYCHGGGFVRGSLDTHQPMLMALALAAKVRVLSLDWPLAPEHAYPSARNLVVSALDSLGEKPAHIFLAGDSAGGNLAISSALAASASMKSRLAGLVLIHPMLDASLSGESVNAFREGYGLTHRAMEWAWKQYRPESTSTTDPGLSPLFAPPEALASLPRSLIVLAELDPARDDGRRLASRLRLAGIPVRLSQYPGVVHNFVLMCQTVDAGRAAVEEIARFIRTR